MMEMRFKFWIKPLGVPCRIIPTAMCTQVTIDLAQAEEGELTGHLASLKGMNDFTNELVVPGDPSRDNTLLLHAQAWWDCRNQTGSFSRCHLSLQRSLHWWQLQRPGHTGREKHGK